jgi:hypothetical protein
MMEVRTVDMTGWDGGPPCEITIESRAVPADTKTT